MSDPQDLKNTLEALKLARRQVLDQKEAERQEKVASTTNARLQYEIDKVRADLEKLGVSGDSAPSAPVAAPEPAPEPEPEAQPEAEVEETPEPTNTRPRFGRGE